MRDRFRIEADLLVGWLNYQVRTASQRLPTAGPYRQAAPRNSDAAPGRRDRLLRLETRVARTVIDEVIVDPEPFDYHDYNRTIVAFHGTTEAVADHLVDGGPFTPSGNTDDWLGRGVYFWEYAPKQAWWWAKTFKKKSKPAVVGAMIRLGNCFDLLDPDNVQLLKRLYSGMLSKWKAEGNEGPSNFRHRRNIEMRGLQLFLR